MLDEKKVKDAFRQAKKDNDFLLQWITYLKGCVDDVSLLSAQINVMQNDIEDMKNDIENRFNESLMKQHEEKVNVHQQFSEDNNNSFPSVESLTEQQKKTFFLISSLQREHGARYIPVRVVNSELYGPQNVGRMQSTVANYLKRLEELHFIERMKKGRLSYVKLSETGMKVIASHRFGEMKASVALH